MNFMKKHHIVLLLVFILTFFSCSKKSDFDEDSLNVEIIKNRKYIELIPADGVSQTVGIMFYPGGLVEPEAYIPLLVPLTEEGYYVVIIKMPSDLAVFSPQRGVNLMKKKLPEYEKWIIMGHSLGGAMAVRTFKDNSDVFSGLILLASYPAKG